MKIQLEKRKSVKIKEKINFKLLFLILLVVSTAGLAALFNGFTGLITAYLYELITGVKKENNENNSVDFTIE